MASSRMGWRADTCAQNVVLIAADNVGMDAADALVMQDVETGGQLRLLAAEGHLQLHGVVLQVGQAALQQHLALCHDTHVVADVLQLAEVVAGHQNRWCHARPRRPAAATTPDGA